MTNTRVQDVRPAAWTLELAAWSLELQEKMNKLIRDMASGENVPPATQRHRIRTIERMRRLLEWIDAAMHPSMQETIRVLENPPGRRGAHGVEKNDGSET